jgi:hypothetical protein
VIFFCSCVVKPLAADLNRVLAHVNEREVIVPGPLSGTVCRVSPAAVMPGAAPPPRPESQAPEGSTTVPSISVDVVRKATRG